MKRLIISAIAAALILIGCMTVLGFIMFGTSTFIFEVAFYLGISKRALAVVLIVLYIVTVLTFFVVSHDEEAKKK